MTAKLRAPGHYRAAALFVLGVAFALGITALVRSAYGWDPVIDSSAILLVSMIAAPLFWLVGLGAFDYWFYWASGKPTRPEDHSSHGAHSWKDYFRINTDHKVIGIQYTVTSCRYFATASSSAGESRLAKSWGMIPAW